MINVKQEQVKEKDFQALHMFTGKKYIDLTVDSEEHRKLKTMNKTVKSTRGDLSYGYLRAISDRQMLTYNVVYVLKKL